jgi:hypothetical protein
VHPPTRFIHFLCLCIPFSISSPNYCEGHGYSVFSSSEILFCNLQYWSGVLILCLKFPCRRRLLRSRLLERLGTRPWSRTATTQSSRTSPSGLVWHSDLLVQVFVVYHCPSQELWFCLLLSYVTRYWDHQTWFLILVVVYRGSFTSRLLLWEQSICKFLQTICVFDCDLFCGMLSWLQLLVDSNVSLALVKVMGEWFVVLRSLSYYTICS